MLSGLSALCWEDMITFSPEHAFSSAGTNMLWIEGLLRHNGGILRHGMAVHSHRISRAAHQIMRLLRSAVVYYPIFQARADWYKIS